LAPLALTHWRTQARVRFLAMLGACGALGAFRLPPVDNLLRALPVLSVTDNRRLTLWVAFALVLLAGMGIDQLGRWSESNKTLRWAAPWLAIALLLFAMAAAVIRSGPWLETRAREHYRNAPATSSEDAAGLRAARALRQVHSALRFLPRYYTACALELCALAVLAVLLRRGAVPVRAAKATLLCVAIGELCGFGFGLNPAHEPRDAQPASAVIDYLRREIGSTGRAIGVGAELAPNTLMRYGLADVRNYDSIELSRSLDYFTPLYERSSRAHTSRREITWQSAAAARERLEAAGVQAIVGASTPPDGLFERVERVGRVWVARINGASLVRAAHGARPEIQRAGEGDIEIGVEAKVSDRIVIAQTFDSGWRADIDGRALPIQPHQGAFLAIDVSPGTHKVRLRYEPAEMPVAAATSLAALAIVLALSLTEPIRSKNRVIGLDGPRRSRYNRSRDLHRTSQPVPH
jgi:hypothetical protein